MWTANHSTVTFLCEIFSFKSPDLEQRVILPAGLRYLCSFQGKYVTEPHNQKPVSLWLGSALAVEMCVCVCVAVCLSAVEVLCNCLTAACPLCRSLSGDLPQEIVKNNNMDGDLCGESPIVNQRSGLQAHRQLQLTCCTNLRKGLH